MQSRVHVLGNAGIDIVLRVARAPEEGETLLARSGVRALGGKGLNQAVVASRAGAAVRFFAPLGDDADAKMVRNTLARENFAELTFPRRVLPTDLSVVIVDDDGANRIVSTSFCADTITPEDAAAFADAIQGGDILLMQGNLSRAATLAAAETASARGGTTVLNLAPFRWDTGADMPACRLIVNALEATQATGRENSRLAARALCRAGATVAIVTLGGAGCLVDTGAEQREFSAATVDVVDTTGAGDTFCGVFAAGLAAGMDMADIIGWAQRAAAITVTRPGAFEALPTADELAACMK